MEGDTVKQCFLPIAALLLASLSGCAKFLDKFSRAPEGFTNVQFSDGRRNLAAAVDGGLIVYAIRQDAPFRTALKLSSEADSTKFTLPNGQYEFLAVGWPTSGMTGTPKCGKDNSALPIALNGGTGVVTVQLTVNDSDCNAAPFTDTAIQSGGLSPATLIFCAADAATFAGKAYVDKCLQHESARFLKPGPALGAGTLKSFTDYDSVSGRFLFMSDQYVDGRDDLYSVKSDGTGMVRQNNPLASTENVFDFVVVPGTGKVFYAADEEVDNEYDLYVSTVGTRGGTLVTNVCNGCSGVEFIKPTPDGSKLIVAGDIETAGVMELYMVDLAATPYTLDKLSAAVSGGGTGVSASYEHIEISPDSLYVTYKSKQATATEEELFTVRLSDQVIRKLSHATASANMDIFAFFQNYNGTKVVWMSDYGTDSLVQTFASEIFPASPDVKTVSSAPSNSGTANWRLATSRSADLVAFTMRNATDMDELYYADFSNLGAAITPVVAMPNGTIAVTEPYYDYIAFVTDGTNYRMAFTADVDTANVNELWVKPVGAGAAVKVSQADQSSGILLGSPGVEPDLGILNYNAAYYLADISATPGQKLAWKANLGGTTNNAVNVAQVPTGSETFNAINVGHGKVFLTFNDGSVTLPFLHDPTDADLTNSTPMSIGSSVENVTIVEAPRHNDSFPGFPNGVFYRGLATGSGSNSSTVDDMFLLENYASSAPTRLSNMLGGTNGSGGVKFRLLAYTSQGGTGVTETGAGIESGCINPPANNGDLASHSFNVPLGLAGATGPFAVAMEIYPNTDNCAGTPQRIIFPYGLANPSASTSPSSVKLTSSAGFVRYYLND